MTVIPETINDRNILYLDIQQDLQEFKAADLKNWVLFVIEDNIHNPIISQFADMCIDKDVLYVCAAGRACSEVVIYLTLKWWTGKWQTKSSQPGINRTMMF